QVHALVRKDAETLRTFRHVIGTALRVMAGGGLPAASEVEMTQVGEQVVRDGLTWRRLLLTRGRAKEALPAMSVRGKEFDGTVVVWVHPKGKASLVRDGQ